MECGGCTLCCEVFPVPDLDKKAGSWCKHCVEGFGCKIYDSRPSCCVGFRCAYNQISNAPIELRPDKCKVIFERVDAGLFLATMHPDYKDAYKGEAIQRELIKFYQRGFSVVVSSFTTEHIVIYPAPGKTSSEVWEHYKKQVEELQERWKNDCSKLHH